MEDTAGEKLLTRPDTPMSDSTDFDCEGLVEQAELWLAEDETEQVSSDAGKKAIKREKKLVDRCVRGEVAAWEELYQQHHPALLRSLCVLLGTKGSDRNLVDELAAQVWYSLVDEDGELLGRFCPTHGARLNTFIRTVAKDVAYRYFRTEQRRRKRELAAARLGNGGHETDENPDDSLSEFLGTLSESERAFTEEYLLSLRDRKLDNEDDRSETSIWQFTRRIRVKLGSFFGE